MPILSCPISGCSFSTPDVDIIGAAAVLNAHSHAHMVAPAPAATLTPRGPKLERPKLNLNASLEDWNAFVRRWETYRTGSGIVASIATGQLLECTGEQLRDIVLRADPSFVARDLTDALEKLKTIAVVPVALGVLRAELSALRQDPDEPFRTFAAKVQGKAETCCFRTRFMTDCPSCHTRVTGDVYYTDEVIRDVLFNGIADPDIRREALSADGLQTRPVSDVIAFVESRETARNANPGLCVGAVSSYRKSNAGGTMTTVPPSPLPRNDRNKQSKCPECQVSFQPFSLNARGHWNKKPHELCKSYWKERRSRVRNARSNVMSSAIERTDHMTSGQLTCIELTSIDPQVEPEPRRNPPATVALAHHIFTKGEWRNLTRSQHPRLKLRISKDGYPNSSDISAVADTGAQSNVWSLRAFLSAGFKKEDLSPVTLRMKAANKSPIHIAGAFSATISGHKQDGEDISYQDIIYVSPDVNSFFLSRDAMLQLGVINNFPTVGLHRPTPQATVEHTMPTTNQGSCKAITTGPPCGCPQRTMVPARPTCLPFPAIPENIDKMKNWLLQRYAGSTFNTCPHQPLPCMEGPPVEIHLREDARPKACHTAAPIPAHWQDKVYQDLLRDEALGVVERVPYGEPVEWCHRMVVTRKSDGTPRRTVDLSPLNKYCQRETHSVESPFHLARRVPPHTWKSVTDAWNGFHSVPLRERDRHLTTFITPFGRWRYARAPQGFLSSGDGYNRRFDAILTDFERKERGVDDTLFYDHDLETHWWRAIDFVTTVGRSGIILNPDKFQFAQRKVDFAGFHITTETIDPLPKFFNAIRDFPTPSSTTDIRSWFGLVNQVASYAQLRDHMAPFRQFLSPKHPFSWSSDLDAAFKTSKKAIIDAIKNGVEIFDVKRLTCLRPDWSKRGIGYFLLQKYCGCLETTPDCCPDGWRITLAGSRFLTPAEQRYAPIEGEALAVTWGLEQTNFFTLGCEELLVATDHKPLVKLFGDRTLDEISNTRLFRLKQRTLPWHFRTIHVAGKMNVAADATSRHPSPEGEICGLTLGDLTESALTAAIYHDAEVTTSITWERLAEETQKDPDLSALIETIHRGFPDNERHAAHVTPFWRYRLGLHELNGVVIYNDRVVVPKTLRSKVVDTLHAAHQGVSAMEARARTIVFWPGMTEDIQRKRAHCRECITNAPSQTRPPSDASPPPATPFEMIFADYFDCGGHHYLVVGDRLSGWTDVFQSTPGSPQAGAEGLIACLRNYFARFGIPEELSSDGGPEFTAGLTRDFLSRWGVRHRVSSAHFPQSNGRAEVAVKSAKRLLRSNTGPAGSLNHDRFLAAMLQLRNSPDPDCNVSPAQIVFGRPIRDAFAFVSRVSKFTNPNIRSEWRDAWRLKEMALRNRFHRTAETLSEHSRPLAPLRVGDRCYIQRQAGPNPKRWDRSGTIIETLPFDSYNIKVDGSGRITRRNRRFLRHFEPATPTIGTPLNAPGPVLPIPLSAPSPAADPNAEGDLPTHLAPVVPDRADASVATQEGRALDERLPYSALTPTPPTEATKPELPDAAQSKSYPKRSTRPPRRYEPESGRWVIVHE